MNNIHFLVVRDESASTLSPTMVNLLIALLVLAIVALLLVVSLLVLRHVRRSRKQAETLPMYNEKRKTLNHRRLTITASPTSGRPSSIYVYQEKQNLIDNSSSPPSSPIPEIRITFPEEIDEAGKRTSGRVVVVRVGEHSIGLEPVQEDHQLPPYQQNDRFQSLDLDRIGGLKEKDLL
jgi:type II secretory pathway pseudopilin PulG